MKDKMNIALCMNSKYVMPYVVCITSILENNKNPIDFYILYSYLAESEIKFIKSIVKKYSKISSVTLIKIEEKIFDESPTLGRSKEAYFRLLIPKVLPKDINRCLYLDGDTIVYKDLNSFYNSDFKNQALIVNEDMGETIFYHKERHAALNIPLEYKYFNSGVMMINLEWFKNGFDMNRIFDWIKSNPEKLKFLDQDILNAHFYDKVTYTDGYLNDYLEILVSPLLTNDNMGKATIVHFIKKPWRYDYNGINAKYWWKYGKKIYMFKYIKFSIINFIYNKLLGLILLIIPVNRLKEIKKIFRKNK
jgi:lipopolysaccharide biosynthesis glycosyltransferase